MKVTVLMTYFDKAPFVEEAVRSVLDSTFVDLELLVVDDASTDDGLARIRAIGDPRIRILESPVNTGRAAAANRGFEAAVGEYVAVLDADDRMLPDRLEKQVAFMDKNPDVGVSGGYLRTIGAADRLMTIPLDDAGARLKAFHGMPVWYNASIIRRSVLLDSGVRCDPAWRLPGMDHVFMARLAAHTRFANLPEVLTEYRIGEQNMRHGRDHWKDRIAVLAEVFGVFGIPTEDQGPELFCYMEEGWPQSPDRTRVRAIRTWIRRFEALNARHGWFGAEGLHTFLERRWNNLYHRLVVHDRRAAWAHVRCSHPVPWHRVRYLLGQALRGR